MASVRLTDLPPTAPSSLAEPYIAAALGKAVVVAAVGERVVVHASDCPIFRFNWCDCEPVFTAPMGRA